MTPDPDRVLERLLAAARAGTEPAPDAPARIRAGVELRLSGGGSAAVRARNRGVRVAFGAAVVGASVLALCWLGLRQSRRGHEAPAASIGLDSPSTAPRAAGDANAPHAVTSLPQAALSGSGDPHAASAPAPSTPEPRGVRAKAAQSASDWLAGTDELTLVREMQQALRSGSPSHALRLVTEHERRFPSGSLTEERESVRAAAQCQLDPQERPSILARFTARFGTSPYVERVKASCR
jgi:hypothetical protein